MNTQVNYSEEKLRAEFEERRPIRDALESACQQYSIRGQKVLELGSGIGYNLQLLSAQNQVLGIEGLQSAAIAATARGVPTRVANLEEALPLDGESFDVVVCFDVLEHLQHPDVCLAQAHRVLKTNGLLLVNVPNHFSLSGRIKILAGSGIDSCRFFPEHQDWNNPHLRFFRSDSIRMLVEQSGFSITDDWSCMFPSLPYLRRWKRLMGTSMVRAMAKLRPDLFCGGFFLISRKNPPAKLQS